MSIDIDRLKNQLHTFERLSYKDCEDCIKAIEQQQKDIEVRDEVIKDMINEYGHHIGFDATGEFIKSKRKTYALDKARELLNIKGDSNG